jgi:hypothetical protein
MKQEIEINVSQGIKIFLTNSLLMKFSKNGISSLLFFKVMRRNDTRENVNER